jgi:hypothetical protein
VLHHPIHPCVVPTIDNSALGFVFRRSVEEAGCANPQWKPVSLTVGALWHAHAMAV